MNIILLSGGSGKRLWPLSNDIRSKQFLEVFKKEDGSFESMVQRMFRMINSVAPGSSVTIATSDSQIELIKTQLGPTVGISIEPCRRDTFPAIALAVSYLKDVVGLSSDDAVVVCPVDPYVDEAYFKKLETLFSLAKKGDSNLVLMGIEPDYPSEKYGYIIPHSNDEISQVDTFKEKPDALTAERYIKMGALWNSGVFAFKLKYVLDVANREFGTSSYEELVKNYSNLKKISFDYAVVEKEKKIQIVRFKGQWKDLGTWDTLTEVLDYKTLGNVITADCENTHIINNLQIPLVALGLKNLVVISTPDGILVAEKELSDKIKNYIS